VDPPRPCLSTLVHPPPSFDRTSSMNVYYYPYVYTSISLMLIKTKIDPSLFIYWMNTSLTTGTVQSNLKHTSAQRCSQKGDSSGIWTHDLSIGWQIPDKFNTTRPPGLHRHSAHTIYLSRYLSRVWKLPVR